jgi:serine/threonine protein phosphatase PrpC
MKFDISTATVKGPRPYQEDRFFAVYLLDGYLLAVADGHGGSATAELVVKQLEQIWLAHNTLHSEERIKTVFAELNSLTEGMRAGTTLSLFWLPDSEEKVYVGVLGDSPVIVKDAFNNIHISAEHNVRSNPKEAQAVKSRGGFVSEGYAFATFDGGGLQMSRALGDSELASILNREPEITQFSLGKESFVVVGSDGCFDPGHGTKDMLVEVITKVEAGAGAEWIVENSLKHNIYDNATAIVVRSK